MVRDGSGWSGMIQDGQGWFRMVRVDSCSGMVQDGPVKVGSG
jgi:hypothetical protein